MNDNPEPTLPALVTGEDQLKIFDALALAVERGQEVRNVLVSSVDERVALDQLRDLLGISQAAAVAVLRMQSRHLAREHRVRLVGTQVPLPREG